MTNFCRIISLHIFLFFRLRFAFLVLHGVIYIPPQSFLYIGMYIGIICMISIVYCYRHRILVSDVSIIFFLLYVTESFNWTAQPANPVPAMEGQDVSLAWQYSLTADELRDSQEQYFILWEKLNKSTLNYDEIATTSYLKFVGRILYGEPSNGRIGIDRSDQATLHIKDVRREDEGTYKIGFTLKTDGSVLAEQRVNLTVLGKLYVFIICVNV